MVSIQKTTVNYLTDPVGIGDHPQFGWVLQSDARGVFQQAYQLQITLNQSFTDIIYDSAWVQSKESAHVRADNLALKSSAAYYWRVRVETADNTISDWSSCSTFVTGLLRTEEWQGHFITAERDEDVAKSNGTYVRKDFTAKHGIRRATLFCTALGLYQPYINGKRIGEDELAPGWTSYHHQLLYQTYDVTGNVKQGQNMIGALLGAGWYKGHMGSMKQRNHYGSHSAFLCQLCIEYNDETIQEISTGQSWEGTYAPVIFSEIYDGEIYDARLEIVDWCECGKSAAAWHKVQTVPFDKAALTPQGGCHVRQKEVFYPAILRTPHGETVLDFKQNLAGWVSFDVAGEPGDTVELQCFETFDQNGNVYLDNLRTAKQRIVYICRGGQAEFHPHFTFQGFRYAVVRQYPGEITCDRFRAVAVYSDMESTGEFHCSHEGLNQLHHNILWGLKSNFVDIPTDCPQRDERLGWTGDAQIFCRTACFLMNTHAFYAKWLRDLAADQTPEGGVPHVVPDILTGKSDQSHIINEGTHSAAAWADVAVINPWTLYLAYGDLEVLKQQYESMIRWVNFMRTHSQNGIWSYKLQFGDWVALDATEGSYFGATPNELICTAYYAYSSGLLSRVARLLGHEADATDYEALHRQIVQVFQNTFFSAEGEMTAQTQTAHILALHFDLVSPLYRQKTAERLQQLLAKENGHLVTGFVGTPYFCHTLSENGMLDDAYALLLKEDFPSWLYQVSKGATTVWEHWDGIKPDGTMWSPNMNSLNHYAYGAIGEWMHRVVAGIEADPDCGGYRHFYLQPHPGGGLRYAQAQYESIHGIIRSRWEQLSGSSIRYQFTVPSNTLATVRLHDAREIAEADGLCFAEYQNGLEAVTGSGEYSIVYRTAPV